MDFYTFIQELLNSIDFTRILKIGVFFTFPLWIQRKFIPSAYSNLKSLISINFINIDINLITHIIDFLLSLLIFVNFIIVYTFFILVICWLLQHFLRFLLSLLGIWIPSNNYIRATLVKLCIKSYFHLALYTVSLAIYSDILLKYNFPLVTVSQTKIIGLPLFPFTLLTLVISISLFSPTEAYR